MNTSISLRNVTKNYAVDEHTVITPVRDVSLDAARGDFIMIIGRSGSGKTTLLNMAAGLIKPSAGEALINATNLWELSDREQSRLRNTKIGFIFQYPSLLPSLTALENVAMPASLAAKNGSNNIYRRAQDLLKMVGLSHRVNAYPRQLSSGEQRRVVIARALMNTPEILLADEPTSDLDTQTEKEIMSILTDTNKSGVTILMVTHGLELTRYATSVYKMEQGALHAMQ
jgi:ABC-type lipoprotein export system ATPase subunit